ncbi:hypothetical protein ASE66_24545 [Bosea sp. Root483D1]|uniref:DUF1254 domain-containing protein n=1 Tax=Bosea sp. Root483D1 TaxID=1736544 RepID=UPI00070A07A7|nr:DUF1254 domain-containing protein [Bosea sp. Root483D1]KRE11686.1 hypothetical protein ASE66_24545 [Bosea sp. Root483D1]
MDLSAEPIVVSVPALTEKRWFIVQIGDYYDQVVYNIGGSKGPEPGLFLVTGPDYTGPIPATMKQIKVRTTIAVAGNASSSTARPTCPPPARSKRASTCFRCCGGSHSAAGRSDQ